MTTLGPLLAALACFLLRTDAEVLNPPYFNLAQGRRVTATATCGEGVRAPEIFCQTIRTNETDEPRQVCDFCDPNRPNKAHPPEYAVDGTDTWWQSPPLSRGSKYNEVNLTINLGQEFHVDNVLITMGNSPRPGAWVLEKSSDYGVTYQPWQYFAESKTECERLFGTESVQPINSDSSVTCETQYSKRLPLKNGEIGVSLLVNRPSANDVNSPSMQEWTRATNVRLRFLKVLRQLQGVGRQGPSASVSRTYFYSIKEINIRGQCSCNGHADTCDMDPNQSNQMMCRCQHNTCGPNCEFCCPGYQQKPWRQSYECERNCEEGSVPDCRSCRDGEYYYPFCFPCDCDPVGSVEHRCDAITGQCLCMPHFSGQKCKD